MKTAEIRTVFLVVVVFFLSLGYCDYSFPYEDTPLGTAGLWHFNDPNVIITPDDNSSDIEGRKNDMTVYGDVQIVTPDVYPANNAAFESAMYFNGASCLQRTIPQFDPQNARVEAWYRLEDGISSNGENYIITVGSFRLILRVEDYQTEYYRLRFSRKVGTVWSHEHIDLPEDTSGRWMHVAMEYRKATDTAIVYLDDSASIEVSNATGGVGVDAGNNTLIGAYNIGGTAGFLGLIDEVRISKAIMPDLSYPEPYLNPHQDTPVGTVGLWNFNEPNSLVVPDDDSADIFGRNNDLSMFGTPQFVTPDYYPDDNSQFSGALKFDGASCLNRIVPQFNEQNARVEAWFCLDENIDSNGENYIVAIGPFRLILRVEDYQTGYYRLRFSRRFGNGTWGHSHADLPTDTAGRWIHVAMTYDRSVDYAKVYIDGTIVISVPNATNGNGVDGLVKNIWVGAYNTAGAAGFKGLIDDLRISRAVMPQLGIFEPYQDTPRGTVGLWHLDEVIEGFTPDDDSIDIAGRSNDFELYGSPQIASPDIYPSNNSDFGNAMLFDGASCLRRVLPQFDPQNARIEAWACLNHNISSNGENYMLYIGQFRLILAVDDYINGSYRLRFSRRVGTTWIHAHINLPSDTAGRWIHYAVEYDRTIDIAYVYINGDRALTITNATAGAGMDGGTTAIIGAYNTGGAAGFKGLIDEVRVSKAVMPEAVCGDFGYLPGDFNKDCYVDILDLLILTEEWLKTTDPSDPLAVEGEMLQYENYNIPFAATTPTIDGALSPGEWSDATMIFLGMPELVTPPNIGTQAYEVPESHEDFSSKYFFKWDNDYLYVGIRVYDDVLVFDDGGPDDHVTLAFDPVREGAGLSDIAFYEMFRDYLGNSVIRDNIGANPDFASTNAIYTSSVQADGWSFEVAFKWTDFDGYTPTLGDVHGTAILICDNDTPGTNRDTFLMDAGNGNTSIIEIPSLYKYATLTAGLSCGDLGYLPSDSSLDCNVDLYDYPVMADNWLQCTMPGEECIN